MADVESAGVQIRGLDTGEQRLDPAGGVDGPFAAYPSPVTAGRRSRATASSSPPGSRPATRFPSRWAQQIPAARMNVASPQPLREPGGPQPGGVQPRSPPHRPAQSRCAGHGRGVVNEPRADEFGLSCGYLTQPRRWAATPAWKSVSTPRAA